MPNIITRLKNAKEKLFKIADKIRQSIKEKTMNKSINSEISESEYDKYMEERKQKLDEMVENNERSIGDVLAKHDREMREILNSGVEKNSRGLAWAEKHGYLKRDEERIEEKEKIAELFGKELAKKSLQRGIEDFGYDDIKNVFERISKPELKDYEIRKNEKFNYSIMKNESELMKIKAYYIREEGLTVVSMYDSAKEANPESDFLTVILDSDKKNVNILSKSKDVYTQSDGNDFMFSIDGNFYTKEKINGNDVFRKKVNGRIEITSEQEMLYKLNEFNPEMVQIYEENFHQSISDSNGPKRH